MEHAYGLVIPSKSGSSARKHPRASSESAWASCSPPIRASSISRPLLPSTSLATEASRFAHVCADERSSQDNRRDDTGNDAFHSSYIAIDRTRILS